MDVLIVDDDAITRLALCTALEEWGFVPIVAENGDQALQKLEAETAPHLLIIDWSMPGMSGPELCKSIRKRDDGQFFYILMLTGKEGNEAIVEAMEAGADDFLNKPFDHRVLKVRTAAGSRIVRLEQTLNQLASRDALTQCWNRRMIDELFANSIAESTRKQTTFSLMILDIDHFKKVNDTYGHAGGDMALKHIVNILNTNLREYDQVGRYGGEEFVVLLPATDQNEAWGVAERIRSAIQFQPTRISDDVKIDLTVSIGLAQFDRRQDANQSAFFERADKALYNAKQSGRNRIVSAE
ncbi:Response regulator PleD [Zhongshania aliphaticivorans]|uniref:diguanylate cyclase n=1 Tax=Zhongshania aliphaticivorans TaxID=1470434 RepID=A0A5S9P5Y5_9GAMM|nr:diguanylate cyclase [Zhongshania aliphaticivorans]CAA0091311.1 Response regulator PleD [Zhongshania aliphaticivorans]CAA0098718.1 Response regulator PleD [Zhongshania aliphaticivorans]